MESGLIESFLFIMIPLSCRETVCVDIFSAEGSTLRRRVETLLSVHLFIFFYEFS